MGRVVPDEFELAAELLAPGGKARGWELTARPEQITPGRVGAAVARTDWLGWLLMAGRGFGKTRAGAEDFKAYGFENPGTRCAIIAPTYADARDTCVEGESGLLAIIKRAEIEAWNRSLGELVLRNGTRFKLFSADEPERLRGPQHHRAWLEEFAAWKEIQAAWDNMQFGLRLGTNPQWVATTTPKPLKLLIELAKDPSVVVTRGSSFDNAANLAPSALAALEARYGGTRVGRQELMAELLEQAEGAMWSRELLDEGRVAQAPELARVVVAVDPAMSSGESSAQTGITVAGLGHDSRGYVLHSVGLRSSPDLWGRRVAQLYRDCAADRVIAEANQGGDLLRSVLSTIDPNLPIKLVHAARGKRTRAEPIAALFEQGRVSLVGDHAQLEDQLVNYTGAPGEESPDVLDSMVWAMTALMIDGAESRVQYFFG